MEPVKDILYDQAARDALAKGADKLARAVVATLGPVSRNVAIDQDWPAPQVLHDGVTIARAIKLKDKFENMGAQLLKEAASQTNDLAGDGTTTATLIANTLIQEGKKLVDGGLVEGVMIAKLNPMILKANFDTYAQEIVVQLEKMVKKQIKQSEAAQIASISAASEELGTIVAEAVEKVGKDGIVMVEESSGYETTIDYQEGVEFDNGWLSPYFVTDTDKMVTEYEDTYILLTDHKIFDGNTLIPIVTKIMEEKKSLLIIADDIQGAALNALAATKIHPKTQAKVVGVMAPEFGDRRRAMLEDLAILTGGEVIDKQLNMKLEDVNISQLGRATKIKVTQTHTTIRPNQDSIDKQEIEDRANSIREQIKAEENDFKRSRLQDRLNKLTGKMAVIKIGGPSLQIIKDKRERIIDAIHATKAALAEGIIPGGGVALKDIAYLFREDLKNPSMVDDLVFKALIAPMETIISNSGREGTIAAEFEKGQGLNVTNGDKIDMVKAGIIDPLKVTKLAITHAFAVAGMFLTTNVLITDYVEPKTEPVKGV